MGLNLPDITAAEERRWGAHFARCESPIERDFLAAYLRLVNPEITTERTELVIGTSLDGADNCAIGLMQTDPALAAVNIVLIQTEVDGYRPDFILWRLFVDPTAAVIPSTPKAVVETDGHDFHEKTKAQAARDKLRDRFLQRSGFYVLRFTGSEVYRDAKKCAAEANEFLNQHQRCQRAARSSA